MMDSYDPRDFVVGRQDVKCAWIVLVLVNVGVIVLSL